MRRFVVSSLACLVASVVPMRAEVSLLVRERGVTIAHTTQGDVPITLEPVQEGRDFSLVILADTLLPEDVSKLQGSILPAMFPGFLKSHQVRLLMVTSSGSEADDAIGTVTQLRSAVQRIKATSTAQPVDVLKQMPKIPAMLPQDWGHAVIVGRFVSSAQAEDPMAGGWLSAIFLRAHCRVSFWSIGGAVPAWAQTLTAATLGAPSTVDLQSILANLSDLSTAVFEATWDGKVQQGAWWYAGELRDAAGHRVMLAHALSIGPGFPVAGDAYLTARASLHSSGQLDEAAARLVLTLNPSDVDALRVLATGAAHAGQAAKSLRLWRQVVALAPDDGAAWASLSEVADAAGSYDSAEEALGQCGRLGVKTVSTLKLQAQIRLRKGDAAGALALLEEALGIDAKAQDLWLLRADCAHSLKRAALEADSLQHAGAVGPLALDRSTTLIASYIAAGQLDPARALLLQVAAQLPENAATQAQYAGLWQAVHEPGRAEQLWKQALRLDSRLEAAYTGMAQQYLADKRYADVMALADAGLAALPGCLPLVLAKETALEATGDRYGARRWLRTYAGRSTDLALLTRWARIEDEHGCRGAEAYAALATALQAAGAPAPQIVEACRRGLAVSIRDEQMEAAAGFSQRLLALGDHLGSDLLLCKKVQNQSKVVIPGGVEALHFLMFGSGQSSPAEFLADYSAALIASAPGPSLASKQAWQRSTGAIHEYFARVQALAALADPGTPQRIELSLSGSANRQRTEKAFKILGLRLKSAKGAVEVVSAEGQGQAKKQNTLAALAIDDGAIQEALAAHKTYSLEVPADAVPVFPAESVWQRAFYSGKPYPGGLAEAFATDLRLPRVYLALHSMDHTAAELLLARFPLYDLADRYSVPLSLYAAALAVNGTHAEAPGGEKADPVWRQLVGVSPSDPAGFFEALLKKDDGRLMAFFYTLSQLDRAHQQFFACSPHRLQRFYELFRDAPEMRAGGGERRLMNSTFLDFLRDVPLNEDGSVDFPGSPEVWMVAKGKKLAPGAVAKLGRKVKRVAAPDDEDQILIRLADTSYKAQLRQESELANFIAVTRIDESREQPLDDEAAMVLAQAYPDFGAVYPLFVELGDLSGADYQSFLALSAKAAEMNRVSANTYLGELNSVLELEALLRDSKAATPAKVLTLYRKAMERLGQAQDAAGRTAASLAIVDDLAQAADPGNPSRDAAIRELLVGDGDIAGAKAYRSVLALQRVPSLDALFEIRDALGRLTSDAGAIDRIAQRIEALPVVLPEKDLKIEGERKKNLERFEIAEASKLVAKLREALARRKRNQRDIDTLSAELMAQLEPWTQLAMTGPIYARFLDASDLLVSEDPLLLRKHEFISLGQQGSKPAPFTASDLLLSSEGEGSYFTGGLAEFGAAAGKARVSGNHLGGTAASWVAASLVASVRATDWRDLNEESLESFAASVRLGREWIVESASSARMYAELRQDTLGLLSLARRKALLEAVAARDWPGVWKAVSVSDLHFLGDTLRESAPASAWSGSPHLQAIRLSAAHADEFDALGPVAPGLNGCGAPRLRRYEPYEEYQRNASPEPIAERVAELKQYVAWLADESAWPLRDVPAITNLAAEAVVSRVAMRDFWDWNAALAAFKDLRPEDLEAGVAP